MSQGYSADIMPFVKDPASGWSQNKTLLKVASQNLIGIVLTVPGERIMHPDMGVGLRNYLFRMNDATTKSALSAAIKAQVSKWCPYIKILEINYQGSDEDLNFLKVNLAYEVLDANITKTIAGVGFEATASGAGSSLQIIEYIEDGDILTAVNPESSDGFSDRKLFANPFETLNTTGTDLMTLGGPRNSEEEAYDDDESPYVDSGRYVDENTLAEHKHVGASYWRDTMQSSLGKT